MTTSISELECDGCFSSDLGDPSDYARCDDCNGQFCVGSCFNDHTCDIPENQQVHDDLSLYDED